MTDQATEKAPVVTLTADRLEEAAGDSPVVVKMNGAPLAVFDDGPGCPPPMLSAVLYMRALHAFMVVAGSDLLDVPDEDAETLVARLLDQAQEKGVKVTRSSQSAEGEDEFAGREWYEEAGAYLSQQEAADYALRRAEAAAAREQVLTLPGLFCHRCGPVVSPLATWSSEKGYFVHNVHNGCGGEISSTKAEQRNGEEAAATRQEPPLSPAEAAEYLRLSVNTLAGWRWKGKGPRFIRVSARCIRYRRADLDAFTSARSAGGEP